MSPQEYFKQCQDFDWYYIYSDDHRVYKAGLAKEYILKTLIDNDPSLKPIWDSWAIYHFSGPAWGIPQAPKPELEDYLMPA
jgi:hypothetical protein